MRAVDLNKRSNTEECQVALSFVFLTKPMPAIKNIAPRTPDTIMSLIFLVPDPPFKKLMAQ